MKKVGITSNERDLLRQLKKTKGWNYEESMRSALSNIVVTIDSETLYICRNVRDRKQLVALDDCDAVKGNAVHYLNNDAGMIALRRLIND